MALKEQPRPSYHLTSSSLSDPVRAEQTTQSQRACRLRILQSHRCLASEGPAQALAHDPAPAGAGFFSIADNAPTSIHELQSAVNGWRDSVVGSNNNTDPFFESLMNLDPEKVVQVSFQIEQFHFFIGTLVAENQRYSCLIFGWRRSDREFATFPGTGRRSSSGQQFSDRRRRSRKHSRDTCTKQGAGLVRDFSPHSSRSTSGLAFSAADGEAVSPSTRLLQLKVFSASPASSARASRKSPPCKVPSHHPVACRRAKRTVAASASASLSHEDYRSGLKFYAFKRAASGPCAELSRRREDRRP